ncbi:MAG TPA: hypothetical protein PKI20_03250 [Verrucomicrobiota bacterium]|nr:hypothetical protein [Verrucomicrobiota bacterium]HQL76752.1 hypothetical protein [Verrucomicrobiota bacterium]
MNPANPTSSRLERWIIGALDVVVLGLLVTWVVNCHLLQIVYILAALALALLAVLSLAAWRHGFRWFCTRRALRFYGWLVAGIVSVIVLFYAEENWRGKRAWAALQREAAARGESLDFSSIIPPPVPDDQNFALAPGVPELLGYAEAELQSQKLPRREDLPFYLGAEGDDYPPPASWAFQQTTDLAAWQNVLLAPSRYDPALAVLRAASQRPQARYPVAYDRGMLGLTFPNYLRQQELPNAAQILCLRAAAELAQDQPESALQDTLLALRLADSLRQMPYDRPHRARAQMLMSCLQPVWEGLACRRWKDPQLAALQQRFADMDLLAEFSLAVRGETFLVMNLADQLQAFLHGGRSAMADRMRSAHGDDLWPVWLFRLFYPTGWLYQDKVWVCRFYERRADAFKSLARSMEGRSDAELRRATDPLLLVFVVPRLIETFSGTAEQALFLQTACQQAAAACALERFRLAKGQYPDTLEALVPAWLDQVPADLLAPNGAKLKYHRDAGGGFVLYSVGSNRLDDHGTPSPPEKDWRGTQATFPRLEQGDWVWRQPVEPGQTNAPATP